MKQLIETAEIKRKIEKLVDSANKDLITVLLIYMI